MTTDEPRSEQQENLELDGEPPADDPRSWLAADPDTAREDQADPLGTQVSAPPGGELPDREPTAIAQDGGAEPTVGPEQEAVRVERGDDRSGRTG